MRTLLIDAATPTLFVGVFESGRWQKLLRQENPSTGALEGLFSLVGELFSSHPLASFSRVVLCEGPGRLMALRIAAVAANQWTIEKPEKRFVYNSLQLASKVTQAPVAYELRTGIFALWQNEKIEITSTLSPGTPLLDSALYAQAIENFPSFADKILLGTPLFDPPLWSPFNYALAQNTTISSERK